MVIGFAVGLLAANGIEWATHKHVLHRLGRNRDSAWAFHWHEHHMQVRRSGGYDPVYDLPVMASPARWKEALGVIAIALAAVPFFPISPGFVAGGALGAAAYYVAHRKAHLDPAWARRWVPWHLDHHLGPNQDANWCVTVPLFDWIMGTRQPYIGTEQERLRRRAPECHHC